MTLETSIQRLRRFGDPASENMLKLRAAAWFLAQNICYQARQVKRNDLPRRYVVSSSGLTRGKQSFTEDMSIDAVMILAKDVATGWLDEIHEALKKVPSS